MLVIKVDVVDAKAAQAAFTRAPNIISLTVDAACVGVGGIADDPKFRGQHDFVALAFDGAAYQFFILVWAVDVRRVEEVDAMFERPVNGGDGLVVIAPAVKLRHPHAAEAEG